MNYFELYDIPVAFDIDESELRRRYLDISRASHPDFHTLGTEEEKEKALEKSTLNNEAYKVLKNKMSRTKYILELFEKIKEGQNPPLPTMFLAQMMDINEQIMELEMDFDQAIFDRVEGEVQEMDSDLDLGMESLFKAFNSSDASDKTWADIRNYYFKKQYLKRIFTHLENLEE